MDISRDPLFAGSNNSYTNNNQSLTRLWLTHAMDTKFAVNAIIDKTGDLNTLVNALMQNQINLGNEIGKILNKDPNKLVQLLQTHIKLAAETVTNLVNDGDVNESIAKLFANSDQVARALASSRTQYNLFQSNFHKHNQFVIDFATQRFKKQFEEELNTYEKYIDHMLMISDMIENAVPRATICQNPNCECDNCQCGLNCNC